MDFSLTDEQQAISELAGRILSEQLPAERLREIETEPDWFARDTWSELAKANLLGIALPEDVGGSGFGIFEACLVLEQVGRSVAPVPYLSTVVTAGLAIAEFGTDAQRAALLPAVVEGDLVLTAALAGAGPPAPDAGGVVARRRDGGWVLDGDYHFVPAAHLAGRLIAPARVEADPADAVVLLVDPGAPGVERVRAEATNLEPQFTVRLAGVEVEDDAALGGSERGGDVIEWMVQLTVAGLCATQAGVCDAALRLTAAYVSEREQFGSKLATFQAVAQRAADAYVDTEAVALTARQAAWRLAEGLPASDALSVAKFWAAEGGQRVVHACQHLHGGIGVDVDYPLHRYFRWAKTVELSLGGATQHLLRIGSTLAGVA